MTAPARSAAYLELKRRYDEVVARIVQLKALLPTVRDDKVALDMVLDELHKRATEMHEILDLAEIEVKAVSHVGPSSS